MNRAARLCHSGAHGGQVVLPLHMARQVVHEWTGLEAALDDASAPLVLFHPSLAWTHAQGSQVGPPATRVGWPTWAQPTALCLTLGCQAIWGYCACAAYAGVVL